MNTKILFVISSEINYGKYGLAINYGNSINLKGELNELGDSMHI